MDREADRGLTDAGRGSEEGTVLAAHLGRSANCSSVGSIVDVLFVSSVVGSAILVSLGVLLRTSSRDRDRSVDEDGDADVGGDGDAR